MKNIDLTRYLALYGIHTHTQKMYVRTYVCMYMNMECLRGLAADLIFPLFAFFSPTILSRDLELSLSVR